ncbi:hypothetical protein JCM18899A_54920 [Nocardioides sp. AN3]
MARGAGRVDQWRSRRAKLLPRPSSAGRTGVPRITGMFYFALPDPSPGGADDNLLRLYNAASSAFRQWFLQSVARGAAAIRSTLAAFERAGATTFCACPHPPTLPRSNCWPTSLSDADGLPATLPSPRDCSKVLECFPPQQSL